MKSLHILVLGCALMTACGDGVSKDDLKSPDASTNPTEALLADEQLAGDNVSSAIDEAIGDAAESPASSGSSSGPALAATPVSAKAKAILFRACAVSGNTAVVTFKRAVERSMSFDKHNRSGEMSFKDAFDGKRTWSKAGEAIACNANGKSAKVDLDDRVGLTLAMEYKVERSRSLSFTNKKGETIARSASISADGSREIAWKSVTMDGANMNMTANIKGSAKRVVNAMNKKGEAVSFSTDVKTDDAAPLVVVSVRDASDALVSRTIVSGKKIATNKDGGRIETVFKDVKYAPKEGCYASSGSISGSVFAKDATEASATYTVSFSGAAKTVVFTYADGTTKEAEYVADGCAFDSEQQEGSATEAATASDVK